MSNSDRDTDDRQSKPTEAYIPPVPAPEPAPSPQETTPVLAEAPSPFGQNAIEVVRNIHNGAIDGEQLAQEAIELTHQDLYGLQKSECLKHRYKIKGLIKYNIPGRAVYEAEDTVLYDRRIALKVVYAFGNATLLTDLQTEAERTGRLDTTYAPIVYDRGIDTPRDFAWMAMEYLEEGTLGERIEKDKRLNWDDTRKVCTDILKGLRNGYAKGLTHRDLKPSNVMRGKGSTWKIVDWGIAYPISLATGVGLDHAPYGTPLYMAPEMSVSPARVSPQSDFYALGIMMIEMVTGTNPFHTCTDTLEVFQAKMAVPHLADYLADADVPEEVRRIVARATAQEPEKRYRDVNEFLAELDPQEARRLRRRTSLLWLVPAAVAVFALLLMCMMPLWQTPPAQFKGTFNMWLVERNNKPMGTARPIGGPNTLPLRVGDRIFLEGKLDQGPDAHFYVLWIDSNGKPTRLHPEEWTANQVPSVDKKRAELRWPNKGGSAKLAKTTDGLESVVWLMRERPLSQRDNAQLQYLLDRLLWQQQPGRKGEEIIVLWENGRRIESRGAPDVKTIRTADDPISQTEKLLLALKEKGLAQYSHAVCYSFVDR